MSNGLSAKKFKIELDVAFSSRHQGKQAAR